MSDTVLDAVDTKIKNEIVLACKAILPDKKMNNLHVCLRHSMLKTEDPINYNIFIYMLEFPDWLIDNGNRCEKIWESENSLNSKLFKSIENQESDNFFTFNFIPQKSLLTCDILLFSFTST